MSKAFVKESDNEDEELERHSALPASAKNYMTPVGFCMLKDELKHLVETERPALVQTVAWAASLGDRSENADYIYGKKRLREIDRRVRFLIKRLESAQVVDPLEQQNSDRVFFGATVTFCDDHGKEQTYQIVGIDEADAAAGRISWVSPLAHALFKAQEGDVVRFQSPAGMREVEVVEIRYV